ncbi:MAG: hypothetical protein ACLQVM_31140 [Terriglobia bacterium]
MNRRNHFFAIGMTVLMLGFTGIGLVNAAGSKSTNANWASLKQLATGQEVRVVLNDGKSYAAEFQGFSDEAIVVRTFAGEQTFSRQNVLRLSAKNESHRMRNVLIGAAAGCGAGLGIAAAYAESQRKEYPQNHYFEVDGPILGVLIGGAGGGLAAALSKGGWHDVYRVK